MVASVSREDHAIGFPIAQKLASVPLEAVIVAQPLRVRSSANAHGVARGIGFLDFIEGSLQMLVEGFGKRSVDQPPFTQIAENGCDCPERGLNEGRPAHELGVLEPAGVLVRKRRIAIRMPTPVST